jgi:rhamnosyltransferase
MDNISIIIRNRNEAEFIGFAIQSCLDHFDKPEIIIVDNKSTDDSLEIANLFKDRTTIKIISIDDYTPGKSINMGVKQCSNDYILVLSAHAQITNMNFERVKLRLKNNNVAVFGNQTPIYKGKKISKRYIWSHFSEEETLDMYSKIEQRYFLHNAFCFYEKTVLVNNPMPEQYPGKEDRYWAKDMIDNHQHYIYEPSISVNHFYTGNGATWKGIG